MAERLLQDATGRSGRLLLVVAAPSEARSIMRGLGLRAAAPPSPWQIAEISGWAGLVLSGVGKSNAAGAAAHCAPRGFAGLVSIGLAGSLPRGGAERGVGVEVGMEVGVGEVVVADACILADEGVEAPGGFTSQSGLGFPADPTHGERFPTDKGLNAALAPVGDAVGPCATVSTCSGTDERAIEIGRRTGALVEDMESAAVGLAAARLGLPFACIRVVSNRTGERSRQGWDLAGALGTLERIASRL